VPTITVIANEVKQSDTKCHSDPHCLLVQTSIGGKESHFIVEIATLLSVARNDICIDYVHPITFLIFIPLQELPLLYFTT
jgi:hypothetical protein